MKAGIHSANLGIVGAFLQVLTRFKSIKLLTIIKYRTLLSHFLAEPKIVPIFALAKSARPIRLSARTQDFHS